LTLQQFLVDFPEIGFPFLPIDCVEDSWEVVGATVDDLIVLAEGVDVAVGHSAELS